jgi:hypothetical protein
LIVVGWSDFAMAHTFATEKGTQRRCRRANGAMQRNKISIFKEIRLPFCALRLIPKHFHCSGNAQQRQIECAAARFRPWAN